jgi:hypothetical protein
LSSVEGQPRQGLRRLRAGWRALHARHAVGRDQDHRVAGVEGLAGLGLDDRAALAVLHLQQDFERVFLRRAALDRVADHGAGDSADNGNRCLLTTRRSRRAGHAAEHRTSGAAGAALRAIDDDAAHRQHGGVLHGSQALRIAALNDVGAGRGARGQEGQRRSRSQGLDHPVHCLHSEKLRFGATPCAQ